MAFLEWLENTGTMTWIRESTSLLGYTLYLAAHTIGLVFLLGPVVAMALRVFRVVPRLPIAPLRSYFPLMVAGFAVNVVSGAVLFATAPVGFVHNVTFLVKLACVLLAGLTLRGFIRRAYGAGIDPDAAADTPRARAWLGVSLAFWVVAITAGRLTAYSFYVISQTVPAVVIVFALTALVAFVAARVRRSQARAAGLSAARPAVVRGE